MEKFFGNEMKCRIGVLAIHMVYFELITCLIFRFLSNQPKKDLNNIYYNKKAKIAMKKLLKWGKLLEEKLKVMLTD